MRTLAVLLVVAACSAEPGPQPVPAVDLSAMAERVRARLKQARAELEPGSGASQGALGMLYHAHDLNDAARVCYANARLLDRDDGRWAYLHAVLLHTAGEDARPAYRAARALADDPDQRAAIRCALGRLELEAGVTEEAERHFKRALHLRPDHAAATVGLARCALARDAAVAAIRLLRSVLGEYPEAGDVHYLLGTAYRKRGDAKLAERHLALGSGARTTVGLRDPWLDAVRALSDGAAVCRRRGDAYLGAERWDKAAAEYRKALQAEPGDHTTRTNLAAALRRLGRPADAERELRRAVDGGATHSTTLFNLAVLVARRGEDEEAAAIYEKVLARDAAHARSRFNLANVYARKGMFEEARAHYALVIPAMPDAWQARVLEARMLILLDRHADARARLEQAHEVFPAPPAIREDLARLLAASPIDEVRDGTRAVALASELLKAGRTPRALDTAAMAYAEAGDFARAVALQEEAQRTKKDPRRAANLGCYKRREPCRTPWVRNELLPSRS